MYRFLFQIQVKKSASNVLHDSHESSTSFTVTETKPMNAMGMQMGSTMSMGSTGSTETESSLESSCSKDSASTSSSLSTSSCEPASTMSYATGGGSSSIASKTTETSTAAYATPRKDTVRTSPIANTDLSTAITQELQRRAQQVDRATLETGNWHFNCISQFFRNNNHVFAINSL